MFIGACVVTAVGILDLDHLGAEIGQRLCAGGPGNDTSEVNDQ